MLNLSVLLEDAARRHPHRDAVVLGDQRLDYKTLNAKANQVANLLVSRGIQPGDKVALSCPNLPQFPAVYNAILKTGAVVVPLNVLLKGREVAYHLEDSDAKAYVCFEGTPELPMAAEGWAGFNQVESCETFFLITATPGADSPIDGAETLHSAVAGQPSTFETVVTEDDGHRGHPVHVRHDGPAQGRGALARQPADERADVQPPVRRHGARGAPGHPAAVPLVRVDGADERRVRRGRDAGAAAAIRRRSKAVALLAEGEGHLLRRCADDVLGPARRTHRRRRRRPRSPRTCGSRSPAERAFRWRSSRQFKDRFHVQILEGYGLSETSPLATFADPDRAPRPGSIGVPIWGIECKLIDDDWNTVEGHGEDIVGEIAIRGHNIMKGYYNRPEATAEVMRDGWFRTGDLARRDEDGYYYIVDRAKDMIIRGGFNVYPREIEEVLMTHPAVSLAAVVGVPHDSHGEEVKAFVIRRSRSRGDHAGAPRLGQGPDGGVQVPADARVRHHLPMTSTGKILKRELAGR